MGKWDHMKEGLITTVVVYALLVAVVMGVAYVEIEGVNISFWYLFSRVLSILSIPLSLTLIVIIFVTWPIKRIKS
jgi:hypothetical protein